MNPFLLYTLYVRYRTDDSHADERLCVFQSIEGLEPQSFSIEPNPPSIIERA